MKRCQRCHKELPENARFCLNCGAEQKTAAQSASEPFIIDPARDVNQQFSEQFFVHLKQRLQEEHDPGLFQAYSERVYESTYRDRIREKSVELQQQVKQREARGQLDVKKFNRYVFEVLQDLLDEFIIRFCGDINQVVIPEAILKYQQKQWNDISVYRMVMDYLDFANEQEQPYTDFLKMPVDKLKNAGNNFLFPARKEKILFIVDTSLLGNCKEGFAMTEHALYWKFPLQKARLVNYDRLEKIERVENWLTINGFFFNVNPSLNLKMQKLLKKIRRMRRGF